MDIVQGDVIILYDDVVELQNQDALTNLRLTTIEEIISRKYLSLSTRRLKTIYQDQKYQPYKNILWQIKGPSEPKQTHTKLLLIELIRSKKNGHLFIHAAT